LVIEWAYRYSGLELLIEKGERIATGVNGVPGYLLWCAVHEPKTYMAMPWMALQLLADPDRFRVYHQLVGHELPPLFLREMPAQQIDAAGVRQLLGFAQAGADHDGIIVDAKFATYLNPIVAVEDVAIFIHLDGDHDAAAAISAFSAS
jgi:hypothetical protein